MDFVKGLVASVNWPTVAVAVLIVVIFGFVSKRV
jgi:hypothetical protein